MAANRRRLVELGMVPPLAAEVANQIDGGSLAAAPMGYLAGLALSNDTTDATNDLQVAAGVASNDTNTQVLQTTATIIKQIDVAFAEYSAPGTPSGGRAAADDLTGAKWFHVYLIGGSGKNTQPLFATSTTPTLPTGFSYKRLLGSVYWTGSAIKAFTQSGDTFVWAAGVPDLNGTSWTSTTANQTLTVPTGRRIEALLWLSFTPATAGAQYARVEDLNVTDAAVTSVRANVCATTGSTVGVASARVMTNTSAQVRRRSSDAGAATGYITTWGYVDARGRLG